ncbi:hypothetical protein B0I35DRAFT_480698 [Stachybotrys elegans]|uniref:Peroxin 20 n=1 Tax=Stachybotrys elegans TaxID=80388 RepID=A0A8K0SM47_9HYPO|nr:hypothetical protein B0I35DRAFT_480698 [Stachybotrys elegans]
MADASCSGTNPFKRLVDQQNRDLSHHQDRLQDHAGRSQGAFRSAQQNSQAQDGFSAFVDGSSSAIHHDPASRLAAHAAALDPAHVHPSFRPAQSPAAFAPPPQAVPNVSNWAADFQRFSQAQQLPRQQPAAAAFAPQVAQQPNFQAAFGQAFPGGAGGGMMAANAFPAFQQPAATQPDFDQEMNRWMASYGAGGGAGMQEVDAMMDQVARELELNQAALDEAAQQVSEPAAAAAAPTAERFTDLETPEIGNLSLGPEPEQQQQLQSEPEVSDAKAAKSAVSEAAKQLLESVQHEDGEKWKNSTFLSLMRDFRDGRKDIVDNEIRQMEPGPGDAALKAVD